jgi:hypothetical protein
MQPLPLSHPGLPGELVLLAAERTVTVTREEHHQDVLAGRAGPTIAELRPCTITAGKHAGQDGLEVVLDGRRVGELTRLMAQRYRPMVDEVRSRGYRAGCEAVLAADSRGIQVELRLPSATERRVTEPPTAPIMIPARSGASPWPGRPATAGSHAVPRQRRRPPGSTHGVPGPFPPAPYGVPAPQATARRRSRRLLGVSAAVVGVLVLASALGNGSRDEVPTNNSSALPSAAAAPAVPAAVEPSPGTTSAVPVAAAVEPAARSTAQARPPAPATSKPTTSKPAPRTVQAAPAPEPQSEPKSSSCDSNYDGCVPIASDVDCAGGSGDGPAYVRGPVRVTGSDIYDLDRGGEPGIGCE